MACLHYCCRQSWVTAIDTSHLAEAADHERSMALMIIAKSMWESLSGWQFMKLLWCLNMSTSYIRKIVSIRHKSEWITQLCSGENVLLTMYYIVTVEFIISFSCLQQIWNFSDFSWYIHWPATLSWCSVDMRKVNLTSLSEPGCVHCVNFLQMTEICCCSFFTTKERLSFGSTFLSH